MNDQALTDAFSRVGKFCMEAGRDVERQKLDALRIAYEKALQDPLFKAPSYLHLSIAALLK